jgi:hypothetical protein
MPNASTTVADAAELRKQYERWEQRTLTVDGKVYRVSGELSAGKYAFVDIYVGGGVYDPAQDMLPATTDAKGKYIPERERLGRWRALPWGPKRRKVMALAGCETQATREAASDASLRAAGIR